MRSTFYWLVSAAIAVLAMHSAGHAGEGGAAMDLLWGAEAPTDVLPVPEPSRAVLLGVGIMAIAFTYRRAWLNMKRKD